MIRTIGHLTVVLILACSMDLEAQVQNTLWGTTAEGGDSGIGTIYKTDADGSNLVVIKSFKALPGRSPQNTKLVQTPNGKFYGMTLNGGSSQKGVLFEYDLTTGNYQAVIHFDGATKGSYPYGSLVSGGNGKLYGMTQTGGASDKGVLFEFDPATGAFAKKIDFDGTNGASPMGDLVLTGSGLMYGVTYQGGSNSAGVLFSFDPATGTFTKKLDLSVATGSRPLRGLLVTTSGLLLGMASEGGTGAKGTLYEYDPVGNAITKRIDFTGAVNGALPVSHLMQASNGLVYGMTLNGGSTDQGVLFEYNATTFVLTKKIDFNGGTRGVLPYGGLMQASNGKIYGATEQGLADNFGGIFEYDILNATVTNVVAFTGSRTGVGAYPRSTLMQASNGKLYGLTNSGGNAIQGVLFELDPTTKVCTAKVHFQKPEDGDFPITPLVQHSNGRLYGVTASGGSESSGILFELELGEGTYTMKKDLTNFDTGTVLQGALCLASNGMLYGAAQLGGSTGAGTLFRYDVVTNTITKLFDFSGSATGSTKGGLIQASNGKLYGATNSGGANNKGVIYEYDILTSTFLIRAAFDGTNTGTGSAGSLVEVGTKLYGLTQLGGISDKGTLYEFDPASGMLTKKVDFTGTNGYWPVGFLVAAPSGNLFGVTAFGGTSNKGSIFEFDASTGSFNSRYSFTGITDIQRGLSLSSNGKFYGHTVQGGPNNTGVLYEFDPITYTYTKKIDFIGPNGMRPLNMTPILVSMQPQIVTFDPLTTKTFGDPNFTVSASSTSGLGIAYESSNPLVATVSGNTVTVVGAGTTTIKAKQEGNKSYFSTSVDQLLTVNKKAQSISFAPLSDKTFGDAPFNLTVSSNSPLPLTVTSSNTNVATINGTTVTIIGAGTTTLTAAQAGNANYLASSAPQALVVNKANQGLNFPPIATRQLNAWPFAITASVGSGLLLTLTSSDPSVATISGHTVTPVSAGTTNIEASQAGNDNYLPVATFQPLTITLVTAAETDIPKPSAYPNPANEAFFIQLPKGTGAIDSWINLVNSTGMTTRLQLELIEGNTYRGDLRQFASGMYVIHNSLIEIKRERLIVIH